MVDGSNKSENGDTSPGRATDSEEEEDQILSLKPTRRYRSHERNNKSSSNQQPEMIFHSCYNGNAVLIQLV